VKFAQRVEACPALQTPEDLEIVLAVGKFHLSAHKLECFPRFSLMFIQGAGHINGEILETLWAPFNKILTTARSMSLAHRQEVYDDHMRDSNWKKLVGMGAAISFLLFEIAQCINVTWLAVKGLCRKYEAACDGMNLTWGPFEELTDSLDQDKVKHWQETAGNAAALRGDALDIYTLKMEKGWSLFDFSVMTRLIPPFFQHLLWQK